ncbi:4-hydroxy-4-methyl-2-oxoglutarate aldolase [Rhodococcus sp. WS4]|nr:4-hydroxy-4-methyl-2-oxoglutarate aldolase [Rhodococcus sp. WS4]
MGRRGVFPTHVKPVHSSFRMSGRAFPVLCKEGSNLAVHQAIYLASPGDVLVVHVEASTSEEYGYVGDIMAEAAKARGLAGLVIDGCVRDAGSLLAVGFPVYSAGLSIRGTDKQPHPNPLVEEIDFGSCIVRTGDLVVGDEDGLVVVPESAIEESFAAGKDREDREADYVRRLRAGERTLDLMNLPELVIS